MKFVLAINTPPGSPTSRQALAFARAVISNGHQLEQLFFFDNGVLHSVSKDVSDWSQLIQDTGVAAYCCINSVEEWICVDDAEASGVFKVAGMAQLAAATTVADRVITFGSRETEHHVS